MGLGKGKLKNINPNARMQGINNLVAILMGEGVSEDEIKSLIIPILAKINWPSEDKAKTPEARAQKSINRLVEHNKITKI